MRIKTIFIVVCVLLVTSVSIWYGRRVGLQCATMQVHQPIVLIDAGHGGADNGTCAADGTAEDGINLSISLPMYDLLRFCGFSVQMTRTEDTSVTNEDNDPSRSWKANDMYARLEKYNAATFTVSIHQNHFSQSKYNGAQVFYGTKHADSPLLADTIQKRIVTMLQPQNTRVIKPAGENIFLLYRTTKPAVIVECGFLSNPEEVNKLKQIQYQQQMAFTIGCGILEYTNKG